MATENPLDTSSEFLADLKASAKLLTEKLQSQQFEEASVLIRNLVPLVEHDTQMFQAIGKLTRGLHDAIVNFHVDSDLSKQPLQKDDIEIHDASSRLNYVIELTQKAAEKTMDIVDEASPVAITLADEARILREEWSRLKRREIGPEEFRGLYDRMNIFLEQMEVGTAKLRNSFQDIILEQGYQDLTGQVLKRVIGLVGGVEADLVKLVLMASQVEEITGVKPLQSDESEMEAIIEKRKHEAEGPQINKERQGVVSGQDEVDDLLSSLGF